MPQRRLGKSIQMKKLSISAVPMSRGTFIRLETNFLQGDVFIEGIRHGLRRLLTLCVVKGSEAFEISRRAFRGGQSFLQRIVFPFLPKQGHTAGITAC